MMSGKRKFYEENLHARDSKQRQRMTTYHLNHIFQTTQQKLYEGSKNFFRKLKESTMNNEQQNSCCSSMHCINSTVSLCDYCEKRFCSNHLIQCSMCNQIYCLYCSTNINNQSSICLTCVQNE